MVPDRFRRESPGLLGDVGVHAGWFDRCEREVAEERTQVQTDRQLVVGGCRGLEIPSGEVVGEESVGEGVEVTRSGLRQRSRSTACRRLPSSRCALASFHSGSRPSVSQHCCPAESIHFTAHATPRFPGRLTTAAPLGTVGPPDANPLKAICEHVQHRALEAVEAATRLAEELDPLKLVERILVLVQVFDRGRASGGRSRAAGCSKPS